MNNKTNIFWAQLILDGKATIEDVPEQYKADVTALTGITTPTVPTATTPAKTDTAKPLTVEA